MATEIVFSITLILATLFTTIVTGFLFAFAILAMPGIKGLTDSEFIRAFQGMDGIIQNNHPLFMLVWGGSVLLLLIAVVLGFGHLSGAERVVLTAAAIIYFLGVQLPTGIVNVPLNNRLQTVKVDALNDMALASARSDFEPRWNQWNGIRTVFASVASSLLIVLLFVL